MNKEICKNCKYYFAWEDVNVAPDGKGLFIKKTTLNEVCCKVNRDIEKIKRCNSYEECGIRIKEEDVEEKVEENVKEVKPEPKEEEPKKEIKNIAEGRRKKGKFVK